MLSFKNPTSQKNILKLKTILIVFFSLALFNCYAQKTLKIKQINGLVLQINVSSLPIQRDTLIKDYPELGLKMITYLEMIVNGKELIKYVNYVNTTMLENNISRQTIASNSFYYNQNKLIKVEEYSLERNNKSRFDWYFSDDKPLYYTLKSDKAEDRANLLLRISSAMVKQIIK
jgi:hypothetical protein